jgi:hypothetical protein
MIIQKERASPSTPATTTRVPLRGTASKGERIQSKEQKEEEELKVRAV